MIKIIYGGVTTNAPAPIEFDATLSPQQKTAERNGMGTLVRETLPDKWRIDLAWEFGDMQSFYNWFKFLSTLTRVYFDVQFPAPTGEILTKTFYISPISAKMINFSRGQAGWWKNMKCTFVEV